MYPELEKWIIYNHYAVAGRYETLEKAEEVRRLWIQEVSPDLNCNYRICFDRSQAIEAELEEAEKRVRELKKKLQKVKEQMRTATSDQLEDDEQLEIRLMSTSHKKGDALSTKKASPKQVNVN